MENVGSKPAPLGTKGIPLSKNGRNSELFCMWSFPLSIPKTNGNCTHGKYSLHEEWWENKDKSLFDTGDKIKWLVNTTRKAWQSQNNQ